MTLLQTPEPRGGTAKFTYASGSRPLEGYTIKRGVGRGGFGEVYYATSDAGKDVALKLVRRNLDIELRGVQQCLNLKHPHLVGLFDIRHDQHGDAWVVMEYVRGESLEDAIRRHTTGHVDESLRDSYSRLGETRPRAAAGLPEESALWWFQGIAAGVGYLHDQGIVHRDVKPGNIFNDEGVVKIGDYGLSKFISASRRSGQTESVGTVHYMAPEVANGRYGKEIDIYALGIVLYEMLTGHVPFEGESVGEVLMKHLTAQPDLSRVPPRYRPAIARALTKDPQQRFGNVAELLTAIGLTAEAAGVGAGCSSPTNGSPSSMPPRRVSPQSLVVATVNATAGDHEEPIAAAVRRSCRKIHAAWQEADFPTPVRVLLIVLAVVVGLFTLPYWIAPAAVLGMVYLVYFAIRAVVIPTPMTSSPTPSNKRANGSQPPIRGTPPTPTPVPTPQPVPAQPNPAAPEARPPRRSERLRRERRVVLPPKSSRQRMTELMGSLLLSTAVAGAMAVVLSLIVAGSIQLDRVFWLGGVGTLGAWGVLVPAKFWEGKPGEPILRRFALLCVGVALGFAALALDHALVLDLTPMKQLVPRWRPPTPAISQDAIFVAYFTFLMPVLRWWRQADPLRRSRFSLWFTAVPIGWAALLSLAWPFEQPWGMMAAATISVSVQLAAPWFDPRRLRADAQDANPVGAQTA